MRPLEALTEEAKKLIPGGVQHNLAFNYPFRSPSRKRGSLPVGRRRQPLYDFLQAGGQPCLAAIMPRCEISHRAAAILRPVTGLFHEYELKLAQLIHRFMPSVEMFRMLGSGTESVMAAIRAARAYTKKKKVIKVAGPTRLERWDGLRPAHPGTGGWKPGASPAGQPPTRRSFSPTT